LISDYGFILKFSARFVQEFIAKVPMQAFGRNQISVSRFRFASDGIFDRFRVSGFGVC